MTKEALKLALEYVELVQDDRYNAEHIDREALVTAIKEALAQPEQETVAWGMEQSDGEILDVITPEEHARLEGGYTVPLYRHPQRTWVGLTEDEAFACQGRDYFETYKAIEAKLKEKNT
jgi:hypothetical protein